MAGRLLITTRQGPILPRVYTMLPVQAGKTFAYTATHIICKMYAIGYDIIKMCTLALQVGKNKTSFNYLNIYCYAY